MKLLVVRFSAIGDCAMAAWPVSALRREGHEIGWAVEDRCAAVVSPELAKVFPIERKAPGLKGEGWRKKSGTLAPLRKAAGLVRAEGYSVGVDLHGHAKTALFLRLAGVRVRFVVNPRDGLAARLGISLRVEDPHEVERAARALLLTTFPPRHFNTRELFAETWDETPAPQAVARMTSRVTGGLRPYDLDLFALPIMPPAPPRDPRLALVAVAAGSPDKALPAPHATAAARALLAQGWRVEMIGGPTDEAPAELGGATNRVGEMSLKETVARIGESSLVVAGDTGAGHIAAAYGVSTISLFGPTDPDRYRPWGSHARVLKRGPSPADVPVEEVLHAIEEVVRSAS